MGMSIGTARSPALLLPSAPHSRARAPPAVLRGVRGGAAAHLQDASDITLTEWNAIKPATIAGCWLKSTIFAAAVAMDIAALRRDYGPLCRSFSSDIASIASLMADCRFGEQAFESTPVSRM